ncbi:DNA-binding IclR family transcriptional regulator [Salinibacterium sp. CAN_S4]|uniref:IclR family transcriptional regulator n=1 Tax=Salinibacterium sp. CAN_S4 TaxID=2787727 RepID=UPI001A31E754
MSEGDLSARQPKAIHSALTVLEEVARSGAGVTAREVSDNLGLPRATAYRLLNLLVQDEYLVRMPDLRGFALGRKVVQLAGLVTPQPPPRAARDLIEDLRERTRGGVHLVRYDSDRMRLVDPDPDFPLSDESRILRQLESSALGRLLLAESGRASPAVTVSIRTLGYATQFGELVPARGCIAVPIRDSRGILVAGLGLSGPVERVRDPGRLLDELLRSGRDLGPLLV